MIAPTIFGVAAYVAVLGFLLIAGSPFHEALGFGMLAGIVAGIGTIR